MDGNRHDSHTLTPLDPEALRAAQASAPAEELIRAVVDTFEGLANPTRARILYALSSGPLCVRDLAILIGLSESAISHQLRFLRDRRLVKSRKAGNKVVYSADDQHVAALIKEAEYHADHVRGGFPDHPYSAP